MSGREQIGDIKRQTTGAEQFWGVGGARRWGGGHFEVERVGEKKTEKKVKEGGKKGRERILFVDKERSQ